MASPNNDSWQDINAKNFEIEILTSNLGVWDISDRKVLLQKLSSYRYKLVRKRLELAYTIIFNNCNGMHAYCEEALVT